ncbi:hypothetical protein ACM66B_004122 [Microbotryomycetes sp. NB124-2]
MPLILSEGWTDPRKACGELYLETTKKQRQGELESRYGYFSYYQAHARHGTALKAHASSIHFDTFCHLPNLQQWMKQDYVTPLPAVDWTNEALAASVEVSQAQAAIRVQAIRLILSRTSGSDFGQLSSNAADYPNHVYDDAWFGLAIALFHDTQLYRTFKPFYSHTLPPTRKAPGQTVDWVWRCHYSQVSISSAESSHFGEEVAVAGPYVRRKFSEYAKTYLKTQWESIKAGTDVEPPEIAFGIPARRDGPPTFVLHDSQRGTPSRFMERRGARSLGFLRALFALSILHLR